MIFHVRRVNSMVVFGSSITMKRQFWRRRDFFVHNASTQCRQDRNRGAVAVRIAEDSSGKWLSDQMGGLNVERDNLRFIILIADGETY